MMVPASPKQRWHDEAKFRRVYSRAGARRHPSSHALNRLDPMMAMILTGYLA